MSTTNGRRRAIGQNVNELFYETRGTPDHFDGTVISEDFTHRRTTPTTFPAVSREGASFINAVEAGESRDRPNAWGPGRLARAVMIRARLSFRRRGRAVPPLVESICCGE